MCGYEVYSCLHVTLQKQTGIVIQPQLEGPRLFADDLAVEIEDEYNPMIPNSYERVVRERKDEHERIREEEASLMFSHA